jgi:hypothetical protein
MENKDWKIGETNSPTSWRRRPQQTKASPHATAKCLKVIKSELEATSVEKWRREWDNTIKGKITKDYFPEVAGRLNTKIHNTQNLTTMITGHGNIKTYLHRFKIADSPKCSCGHNDQTTEHLLLDCTLLNKERDTLISAVSRTDDWPINKHILIRKHYKAFTRFTNQI